MRLLFLTQSFVRHKDDFYSYFLRVLTGELVKQGHTVAVVAPHAYIPELNRSTEPTETIDGVGIHRFQFAPAHLEAKIVYQGTLGQLSLRDLWKIPFYFPLFGFFVAKAIRVCRRFNPDVVVAHWWIPGGMVGTILAAFFKKPLVVSIHGRDLLLLQKKKWVRWLARWVFSKAAMVTVVSNFLARLLEEIMPEVKDKLVVAYMPVADWYLQPQPMSSGQPRLVLTGAVFTEQKCLDDLIEAFRILDARAVPFEGFLVGNGPLEADLKNKVAKLGLSEKVRFKPFMPPSHFAECYRKAWVCVLPSANEGYGLFLAEAQLCGRPVIGADSGGIRDIIEHNVSGLLVPLNNPQALAGAIEQVLQNEDLAKRLVKEGLSRAQEKHAGNIAAARYADLCFQTIAKD